MSKQLITLLLAFTCVGCSQQADTGTVPIEISHPYANVSISVDGKPIKVSALRQPFEFPAGEHVLIVEGEGFEKIEETFFVIAGQNPVYRIALRATPQQALTLDEALPGTANDDPDGDESTASTELIAPAKTDPPESGETSSADEARATTTEPLPENNTTPRLTPREQELAAWAVSIGGQLTEGPGLGILIPNEASLSENDFRRFRDLPNLHTLIFAGWYGGRLYTGANLTDNSLLQMSELPKLATFGAQGSGITDRSMQHLARFPIVALTINNASITDEGINVFQKHTFLQLNLSGCRGIKGQGLVNLDFSNTNALNFAQTGISDSVLERLIHSPKLASLNMANTEINGTAFRSLESNRVLSHLDIRNTKVNDRALAQLSGIKTLTHVHMNGTAVTVQGLRFLIRTSPDLIQLDLAFLRLPKRETIDWSSLTKLERLDYVANDVGNSQLLAFASLKNLKYLKLTTEPSFFSATQNGLTAFQKAVPDCRIHDQNDRALAR